MMDCIETKEKPEIRCIATHPILKESKSEVVQNHVKGMKHVVKILENTLTESHVEHRNLLMHMHIDDMKNQNATSELDEAKKENKQLLNILQQNCHENDVPRSQVDLSSAYSTMSVVNLQCKYEELLAKYEGLLKIMILKDGNIQKCHNENGNVSEDVNQMLNKLHNCERTLKRACDKYLALKKRKDSKIDELKNGKETICLAHSRALQLLHREYLKQEDLLKQELIRTLKPEEALLLREVQRVNKLQHENILLKQEIACLKSKCNFPNLIIHRNESEGKLESKA